MGVRPRQGSPSERVGNPLQKAPGTVPKNAVIPRLLNFGKTPQAWVKLRQRILEQWLQFLGPFPPKCDLTPSVVGEETLPAFTRRKVRYRVEAHGDGLWVEAYLLIPRSGPSRRPAVLVFHSTTEDTIREPAGLAGPRSLHTGPHLAERGYVVLCPTNYLWDRRGLSVADDLVDREMYLATTARALSGHPNRTGMGKMIWDGIRAVDYLQTLDEVDPDRIGCFGFSLGGKEALYAAAFDSRLQATVSTEGGIGLTYSNWHDPWYLGPRIREPGFAMDNHEVLALVAPRAFLLAGSTGGVNEEDGEYKVGYDGERSWPYIASALPLYEMLGAKERIGLFCHACGHSVPSVARETAYAWLDTFLR